MTRDKFAKWTNPARRVLVYADEEAKRYNHQMLDTAHLSLGLLREKRVASG